MPEVAVTVLCSHDDGCDGHPKHVESDFAVNKYLHTVAIMIDQKQLENVESFKYLGSILTNDGRCTCEIKCRIAMAKAPFNKM